MFALKSFMTGADFQGDVLRLTILDKVPFVSPSDIIFAARCEAHRRHVFQICRHSDVARNACRISCYHRIGRHVGREGCDQLGLNWPVLRLNLERGTGLGLEQRGQPVVGFHMRVIFQTPQYAGFAFQPCAGGYVCGGCGLQVMVPGTVTALRFTPELIIAFASAP